MSNILKQADQIVNHRAEERERMYGPFFETMEAVRDIYNAMQRNPAKHVTTEQVYHMMLAMKLAREGYSHKEDNLLDLCAYAGSLNDYLEEQATKAKAEPEDKDFEPGTLVAIIAENVPDSELLTFTVAEKRGDSHYILTNGTVINKNKLKRV